VIYLLGPYVGLLGFAFLAGFSMRQDDYRHPPITPLGILFFTFYIGYYIVPVFSWCVDTMGRILTYEIWRPK
jgi:hypothetical protein